MICVENRNKHLSLTVSLLFCFFIGPISSIAGEKNDDQLLKSDYFSASTQKQRQYFVYLPKGYNQANNKKWPVMFFLHGHGQRGNGSSDLDYVLTHGPLMEAWIQRRPLPFIIISPQLPLKFGIPGVEEDHSQDPLPRRLESGVPERNYGFKSDLPIRRFNAEEFPDGPHSRFKDYPNFKGWINIHEEIILMLDKVLQNYHADPGRVYLTGISYGGFGTFDIASQYPDRWAAIAPVVGTGKLQDAQKLADAALPIWIFGGAKDTTVKPHWLYEMANALQNAGHPALRFTVHEDMDHDAWKRVYEGEDLFNWFLRYRNDRRPH
ncbi:MAG: prolyl oligopeptidase family serine peptidase [Gammaproteobacteria bacterium]|nr:prolyl oligopeptidase family serine peptidase [Gammaproteobacteria bacterium]